MLQQIINFWKMALEMKTFKEVKVGDIIYSLLNKEIVPIKITEVIQNYSECCKIAFKADVIDLNCINGNEVEFSILVEEYKSSICGNSFSTSYELLKEVCALQELQERINNRNILATSTQTINLRFRN